MSAFEDIWGGIVQGVTAKVKSAEQRLEERTGVTAERGNTGSYLGLSIVDAVSGYLKGAKDDLQAKVLQSGTGKSLVSQATKNQIADLVGDWRTWVFVGGLVLLFMFMGGAIARGGK